MAKRLIILSFLVLVEGQLIYPDQYESMKNSYATVPGYSTLNRELNSPAISYSSPAYPLPINANVQPYRTNYQGNPMAIAAMAPTQPPAASNGFDLAANPVTELSPLAEKLPQDWAYHVNNIISNGVTKFTLDLQNAIYNTKPRSPSGDQENVIFSPLSIAGTLALVLLGSSGKTFDEVANILGLEAGVDISAHSELVHQMFGLLLSVVHDQVASGPRVDIATAIFVQEGFPIRPEFKSISQDVYKSDVLNLDFQRRGKEAQQKVNDWVKTKTMGKITSILSNVPPPSTNMIIASALYFIGEWNQYFINGATTRRPFSVEPGKSVEVDMMYNGGDFPFYEDKNIGVKIIGLPYKGLETTMYILLPKAEGAKALRDFESRLTAQTIEYLIKNTKNQTCVIGMPRMKLSSSLQLKRALQSLGLTSLFDPKQADLSLLSPGPGENLTSLNTISPTDSTSQTNSVNRQTNRNNNKDIFVFSRFGDGDGTKKNFFSYRDNTHGYSVEQWATGFNIKKAHRARRAAHHDESMTRSKRQSRPIAADFLRMLQNQNFRSYGLDSLRNSANIRNPGLFADNVLHKVEIDIDEKGTEAAAVTAVTLERDGRQKRLLANRPFVFFIRHNPTKLMLFWGTINTPTPNYPAM